MSERIARDIEMLADLFKAGGWDELRVEADGLSLLFANDLSTPQIGGAAPSLPAAAALPVAAPATPATPIPAAPAGVPDPAWRPVVAPNLGTFYRSPKPGAAPFVDVGQRVEANTEICLLEVMKLFTSVKAGIAGTVRRIDANDAELVEGGQTLFQIEPA